MTNFERVSTAPHQRQSACLTWASPPPTATKPRRSKPRCARLARRRVSVAALLLSAACSSQPAQSPKQDAQYQESLRNICHVDELAQLDANESPISIEGDRHEWLMNHVKHPDLIELITLMRVRSNPERARMLQAATDGTPESTCPLAQYYRENSE